MLVLQVGAWAALSAVTVRAVQSLHLWWSVRREGDPPAKREAMASLLLYLSLCGTVTSLLFAQWDRPAVGFAVLGVSGAVMLTAIAMRCLRT
jgi:hypothetical protein